MTKTKTEARRELAKVYLLDADYAGQSWYSRAPAALDAAYPRLPGAYMPRPHSLKNAANVLLYSRPRLNSTVSSSLVSVVIPLHNLHKAPFSEKGSRYT